MLSFTDKNGREWNLKITCGVADDVLDATGVDLYEAAADQMKLVKDILADVRVLTNVVWAIIKPQAGEMTPRQFKDALDGDTIEKAGEAFLHAIADFSNSHLRKVIFKGMEKGTQIGKRKLDEVIGALDRIDVDAMARKTKREVEHVLSELISDSSPSNGPGSLESAPVPSGSAN